MKTVYGAVPDQMVVDNMADLINQVFKLLPFKETNDERLESHFSSVLSRLTGLAYLFNSYPEWLTVISVLEMAQHTDDLKLYRKLILDSCSTLQVIQSKVGDQIAREV